MTPSFIIPFSFWIICAGLTIFILIVMFLFYAFLQKQQRAFLKDSGDITHLAARRQQLEADIKSMREWKVQQKAELQRLNSERDDQERVRAELTDLERRCSEQENLNQSLRNEVGDLENQKYLLSQTKETLDRQIKELEANIRGLEIKLAEAEDLDQRLIELRRQRDEFVQALQDKVKIEASLAALTLEKAQLESRLENLQRNIAPMEEKVATLEETANNIRDEVLSAKSERDEVLRDLNDKREAVLRANIELSETRAIMETLGNDRASLENRVNTLTDNIGTLTTEKRRLEQKVEQIRDQVLSAETLLNNANVDVQEKQHQLGELRSEWAQLEELSDSLRERCGKLEVTRDNLESDVTRFKSIRDAAVSEADTAKSEINELNSKIQVFEVALSEMNRNSVCPRKGLSW